MDNGKIVTIKGIPYTQPKYYVTNDGIPFSLFVIKVPHDETNSFNYVECRAIGPIAEAICNDYQLKKEEWESNNSENTLDFFITVQGIVHKSRRKGFDFGLLNSYKYTQEYIVVEQFCYSNNVLQSDCCACQFQFSNYYYEKKQKDIVQFMASILNGIVESYYDLWKGKTDYIQIQKSLSSSESSLEYLRSIFSFYSLRYIENEAHNTAHSYILETIISNLIRELYSYSYKEELRQELIKRIDNISFNIPDEEEYASLQEQLSQIASSNTIPKDMRTKLKDFYYQKYIDGSAELITIQKWFLNNYNIVIDEPCYKASELLYDYYDKYNIRGKYVYFIDGEYCAAAVVVNYDKYAVDLEYDKNYSPCNVSWTNFNKHFTTFRSLTDAQLLNAISSVYSYEHGKFTSHRIFSVSIQSYFSLNINEYYIDRTDYGKNDDDFDYYIYRQSKDETLDEYKLDGFMVDDIEMLSIFTDAEIIDSEYDTQLLS